MLCVRGNVCGTQHAVGPASRPATVARSRSKPGHFPRCACIQLVISQIWSLALAAAGIRPSDGTTCIKCKVQTTSAPESNVPGCSVYRVSHPYRVAAIGRPFPSCHIILLQVLLA